METQYQLLPSLSEKEYENLKADIAARRIFGNELRDAFVLRVLQAAEFMNIEQIAIR